MRILQFGLRIHRLLERSIWSWFKPLLRWNLDFSLRAPLSRWWRRVLRTIWSWDKIPTTPRGQSLWILCASTRDLWILGWFCGFIWLRGGVFWTSPSLQIETFLVQLWWSWKLPEPPWSHLGWSWIISEIFKIFHKFVILDLIFTTFCHRLGSCWNVWS